MNALQNIRIGSKITLGFGIVLILLVAIAIVSWLFLSSVNVKFGEYRGLARAANAVGQVQANMLMTRMNVKDFIIRGTAEEAEEVRRFQVLTQGLVETALGLVTQQDHVDLLNRVGENVARYEERFEEVVVLQAERDELVNGTLNVVGPQIERALTEIMESAFADDDAEAAYRAGLALRNLLLGRIYVMRFLVDNDEASYERVQSEFADFADSADDLEASLQNPHRRQLATRVTELIAQYRTAFERAHSVIMRRNATITGDLDVLGPQVADEIENFKLSITSRQDELGPQATAAIAAALWIVGGVATGALILGILAAWLIGTGISRPIVRMTAAMAKLAGGDKTIAIPHRQQEDEVGGMAQAVQVFKDGLIKADELAEEAAREQEARNRRAAHLDSLTKSFDEGVQSVVGVVSSAAEQMHGTAEGMTATAEQTSSQATAVAAASEQASGNVQTVATAAEELSSSIEEIGRQVDKSSQIAAGAKSEADAANDQVGELAETAQKIGEVVQLITSIAEQTNLLALNATIEAARAGDAGKGFAVVASEVKSLAGQTAKATDEIAQQIGEVQSATTSTVEAIHRIGERIAEMNEIASTVASAVEEQNAATQEIARNVQQAAAGTQEVSSNIAGVTEASASTGEAATDVLDASVSLAKQAEELKSFIQQFLTDVRAA